MLSEAVYLLIWTWVVWSRDCFEIRAGWWTLKSISDKGLEKTTPANSGHGDAGGRHFYDRDVARSPLVPLSAIENHWRWQDGRAQCLSVPIGFQNGFSWFHRNFFQLIGHLTSYWTIEGVWNINFTFEGALNRVWIVESRFSYWFGTRD
jgi:hypothetical protein